jgi:hypothetical protein
MMKRDERKEKKGGKSGTVRERKKGEKDDEKQ